MRPSEQRFRERTKLAGRERHSRPKQKIVFGHTRTKYSRRAGQPAHAARKALRPVMAVKISHEPKKRDNLAFKRRLPTIRISPVDRREVCAVEGVSKKHVSTRRHLCTRGSGENET